MKTVGLLPNMLKKEALELTNVLVGGLEKRNVQVLLPEEAAYLLQRKELGNTPEEMAEKVDMIIVLGGDGTLLRAARMVAPKGTPLIGINLGYFGFLMVIEPDNVWECLDEVLNGNYILEPRSMLEAKIYRQGREDNGFIALNEVAITRGASARMIKLKAMVGEQYLASYSADGLIVATSTGSTAYSLSAGGPIMAPTIPALIITPICSHSLFSRPIIIPEGEQIKIVVEAIHHEIMLTLDGQHAYCLLPDDVIVIKKASCVTNLIRTTKRNFYAVMSDRFKRSEFNYE